MPPVAVIDTPQVGVEAAKSKNLQSAVPAIMQEGPAMRGALMTVAVLALLAVQTTATAQPAPGLRESEFQITPRVGAGELRVDRFQGLTETLEEIDTHGVGVGFGFLTPIGVVIELGGEVFGEDNFFDTLDSFNLRQEFVSLGYQFELGSGWRFVPRAGVAHWKLRSEEGWLFNPGPEEVRELKGDDFFWEASVSRRISRVVSLGLDLKQGNYDFGRTRSAAFVVTLGF